ncbi:MAG: PVC-type heme-binding CxxCH protein [Planctomycetaceae bacterium]
MIAAGIFCALILLAPRSAQAQPLVVETDPLSPEEQRGKFHLPPGFEIQLVASEPDIGQPMNMNFDSLGRLWVTSSVEYPYPVAGAGVEPREERWGHPLARPARDWVTVLTDIDDTGKPASIRRFAEGLNIPIGIIPDGDGAIVYSIPNIERFRDTDGDGKADERMQLYGPFGNQDTHGMVNSFTRGLDGWIYACHGFRNTSKVQGTDGHVVEMNSGNTFRFKPDGSRIEHWTHGQVNPFGLCFDPWGSLYSADCHSKPLTCLLRGAYYPSFGKPHDGLGFGPNMIDHNHGSTGICGCAWYEAEQFPVEYDGCLFLCNPVTGRVHRDKIEFRGSSPWAVTQPDFITCDDGWFRPVDVKLGPDGALYIADFYNAIIGHYEVPLEHPRRDRTHGRIWRVVYRGKESRERRVESPKPSVSSSPAVATDGTSPLPVNLETDTLEQLIARLGDANWTVRCLAVNAVVRRFPRECEDQKLNDAIFAEAKTLSAERRQAMWFWVLSRLGWLPFLNDAELSAKSPLVVSNLILAGAAQETFAIDPTTMTQLESGHPAPHAVLAYFKALAERPEPMWRALGGTDQLIEGKVGLFTRFDDAFVTHAQLIAQRELLGVPEVAAGVLDEPQPWLDAALGTTATSGCEILLRLLFDPAAGRVHQEQIVHIARYGNATQLDGLIHLLAFGRDNGSIAATLVDFRSVQSGLSLRGDAANPAFLHWGRLLAKTLLDSAKERQLGWTAIAYGPQARSESAFGLQTRRFADGQQGALLHSSFPLGETGTGILRSDVFELPEKLSFFIAGHNGLPSKPATPNNLVRLYDADKRMVLFEALPPRNDTAQRVEWDLSPYRGQRGYIEIVDGDDQSAYAWLAVGRFSLEGLNPATDLPQMEGCRLIAKLKLTDMAPRLVELLRSKEAANSLRSAAAEALLALYPDARLSVLREAATTVASDDLREQCFTRLADQMADMAGVKLEQAPTRRDGAQELALLLKTIVQSAPADGQRQLAMLLAGDRDGAQQLLTVVEQGAASPRLLQDAALVERLRTWNLDEFETRLAKLTADLPAADAALAELLDHRRRRYLRMSNHADAARGRAVFKQHCAGCHRIGNEGAKIGPQLDGIGVRGFDRLLEDILDPNRNVDVAFRTSVLVLKDGRIVTGLIRREDGATLVLADTQGKEFSVPVADIDQRRDSALSLMPAQLGEKVPAEDLIHLLQYLLSTRTVAGGAP